MAFPDLELSRPEWLWLLPALAVAVALLGRRRGLDAGEIPGLGQRLRDRYLHPLLQHTLADTGAAASGVASAPWRWLVLTLLVLSLSGPVRIGERLPEPPRQRDIVFLVDTSLAMRLRDYVMDEQRVARLTVLKGVLGRFIDGLRGERLALIAYADQAYPVVPLTHDHGLLRSHVARLDTGIAGRSNGVGDALAMAVELGSAPDAGAARRRVLVLFSSASTPTGTIAPETAAAVAGASGWRLYTVAIGAGTMEAEEQRTTGLIYRPVDLERLRDLATATGGRFFQAGDTAALSDAIAAIDAAAMPPEAAPPRFIREPLYQWPLLAALMLLSAVQTRRLLERPA